MGTDPAEGTELPHNVEMIPARRNLEDFEGEFKKRNKFAEATGALAGPLAKLDGLYDFIFLDTAPNASAPTIASYKTAHWFILSTEASKLSVDGLKDALTDIVAVREAGNPNLRLLGVIMCKVDSRTRIASTYVDSIRAEFLNAGEMGAFTTLITRATAVEKAQALGKTVFQPFPDQKIAEQFRQLAREVLSRLETAGRVNAEPVETAEKVAVNA